MYVSCTYLHVFFCIYVQIHQFVFDKNTCKIRTNRFTDAWDNTGEFGVNLSSLDKVLAYKTIEHLDKSVAKEVAVGCNRPGFDLVRGGAKFWGLAQHSFQLVRDEQRVLCMFLVKDVVDSVVSASKLQML